MANPASALSGASSSIPATNGAPIEQPDIEMKEELPAEVSPV